jgi:hypothetical protein
MPLYGLPSSTIFFVLAHKKGMIFMKKGIEQTSFDFFLCLLPENYLISRAIQQGIITYLGLQINCLILQSDFLPILNFSTQILITVPYTKCHQNIFNDSRVVPCERTEMTKPPVTCPNFEDATKKQSFIHSII